MLCKKCGEEIWPHCLCSAMGNDALSESARTACYIAVTHEQHPLTGGSVPLVKKLTKSTTVGEIIDWYYKNNKEGSPIYDIVISEAV